MNNIMSNEQICEVLEWTRDKVVGRGKETDIWLTPEENPVMETPDFHDSLDAQDKWLWPHLQGLGYFICITDHPAKGKTTSREWWVELIKHPQKDILTVNKFLKGAFIQAFSQVVNKDGG